MTLSLVDNDHKIRLSVYLISILWLKRAKSAFRARLIMEQTKCNVHNLNLCLYIL